MESNHELEGAIRALQMQLAEGVDEWILLDPQSRFGEAEKAAEAAQSKADAPKPRPSKAAAPTQSNDISAEDFQKLDTDQAIFDALLLALPQGLVQSFQDPLEALGDEGAEIAVLIDPPARDAKREASLLADPAARILLQSLQAIALDMDAQKGKEPRARLRFVPISPWRMPQDRKFLDGEAVFFAMAIEARLRLQSPRLILLAGSNLAGLEEKIEEGKLFGVPAISLISPKIMLREPMLKRKHWQNLLLIHQNLEEYLKP